MNQELKKEISESSILKLYVEVQKLAKYIHIFKWIAGITFVVAFTDVVIYGEMHNFIGYTLMAIWFPGILFAFFAGFLHFLVGIKFKNISNKYNVGLEELKRISGEVFEK
jgi:hypothetical protein